MLADTHDVKWFRGVAEYANVYVFWNEGKIVGMGMCVIEQLKMDWLADSLGKIIL